MPGEKGFVYNWSPRGETLTLVHNVQGVLTTYSAYLPLTLRQIYYRLVAAYDYPKTERFYKKLTSVVAMARRANMIDFEALRDDGMAETSWNDYTPTSFDEMVASQLEHYRRDRQEGQDKYIELWCEAKGMMPQMERVAVYYGIPVYSKGGYVSVTGKYQTAMRTVERGKPTLILHIGDHDPSGVGLYRDLHEDAGKFANQTSYRAALKRLQRQLINTGELPDSMNTSWKAWVDNNHDRITALYTEITAKSDIDIVRVAITPEQAIDNNYPSAPPKASDSRTAGFEHEYGEDTWQAEAIPPDELQDIIREAIEDNFDTDILQDVLDHEKRDRDDLRKKYQLL